MSGGAMAPFQSPPSSAAATSLAPGFRFHPTDEELVIYYLKRKISGRSLRVDAIAEVDLYKTEPWDLPGLSRLRSRDQEWYFFSPLDRKYSNRSRTNRATGKGYWKTTGKDRPVHHGGRVVGMKKTLVYHDGRPPRGKRTNWVMHEYRLEDEQLIGVPQDDYVVCRIFQKKGAGPMNGAQYGAPFVEKEWEDEEVNGSVMLSDGAEYESNDEGEAAFLEVNDFLPSQDLGSHDGSSLFVVNPDGQSIMNDLEQTDILLEEMLKDTSLVTGMLDGNEEPGQQSSPTISNESTERPLANYTCIFPGQITDDLGQDPASFTLVASHSESLLDGVGKLSNLEKILDVEEFFDAEQPELLPISPEQEMLYLQPNERDHSGPEAKYGLSFYDASDYDLAFKEDSSIQMDESFCLPDSQQSGFEMVDDLMAYFDATDANLKYGTLGYLEDPKEANGDAWKTNQTTTDSLANISDGLSSSPNIASHHFRNKHNEFTVRPAAPSTLVSNKTNLLANMFGAIPAPPAFAAESLLVKSVGQMSVDRQPTSLVTAGFMDMHGLAISSDAKIGYSFLSRCWETDKLGRNEPATRLQDTAVSAVLRGGVYLFFFSAMILGISYKLGKCLWKVI